MVSSSVTAIITFYNEVDLVKRAILSAAQQSHSLDQIIVVDDSGHGLFIKTFNDDPELSGINLKVITHKNNLGLSRARNHGIEANKSTWVAFLDADDYWDKDKIKIQLEISKNTYQAISCQRIFLHSDSKSTKGKPVRSDNLLDQFFNEVFVFTCSSTMIHSSVFQQVGFFNESLESCEDWEFFVRCLIHKVSFEISEQYLLYMGVNNKSMTNTHITPESVSKAVKSTLASIPESEAKATSSKLSPLYLALAEWALPKSRKFEPLIYALKSLRYDYLVFRLARWRGCIIASLLRLFR